MRKYLVVGKNLYFLAQKPDAQNGEGLFFEVEMSVEEFWKLEKLVKESDFLIASGAPKADVTELSKKIFKICSQHAVHEKDRVWLSKRI